MSSWASWADDPVTGRSWEKRTPSEYITSPSVYADGLSLVSYFHGGIFRVCIYFLPVSRYNANNISAVGKGAALGETELQFSKKAERDSASEEERGKETAQAGKDRRTGGRAGPGIDRGFAGRKSSNHDGTGSLMIPCARLASSSH